MSRDSDDANASVATSARLKVARMMCVLPPPPLAGAVQRILYASKQGRARGGRFVRRSPTGSLFQGSLADYHAFSSGVRGYSEWRLLALAVALVRPGEVIVEAGAHVGTETIGYSDIVGANGQVIAFEPNPENASRLRDALAFARHRNVEIIMVALGGEAEPALFAIPPAELSSGTGHLLGPSEAEGAITYYGQRTDSSVIQVDCRSLDDYADDLRDVSMLALDAEGAEFSIIKGAQRLIGRDRPAIVIEASAPHLARAGHSIAALFDELRSQSYAVYEIQRSGRLRDLACRPPEEGSRNWLCLHGSTHERLVALCRRSLMLTALLPMVPGLNPLTHPRFR